MPCYFENQGDELVTEGSFLGGSQLWLVGLPAQEECIGDPDEVVAELQLRQNHRRGNCDDGVLECCQQICDPQSNDDCI